MRSATRLWLLAPLAIGAFLSIVACSALGQDHGRADGPVVFIALGDMPYGTDQEKSIEFIGDQIEAGNYPFVVHYGDVKAGEVACSNALLEARRDLIYGELGAPVIFTPGDNDWTDCDRKKNSTSFDELDRLAKLRMLFFAPGHLPADSSLRVARQDNDDMDYPENARWQHGGVVFATLHIVGTDNGRAEIRLSKKDKALNEVDRRDTANLSWLNRAFAEAERTNAAALVLFMHADPLELEHWPKSKRTLCSRQRQEVCNPYLSFLQRLTEQADQFDKPVLLVHGSTAPFCLDSGFGGWRAPKLWRLNGPGDFVVIDAAVVTVETDQKARVPFRVRGLLSGDAVPACKPH